MEHIIVCILWGFIIVIQASQMLQVTMSKFRRAVEIKILYPNVIGE